VTRALALVSDRFAACIDPRHGGEIFALVDLERGRNVLAGAPFSPEEPDPTDLGFEAWVRAYRGGWQIVAPNVGAECSLDGEEHAFHGRASTAPWEVASDGRNEAVLTWRGHGLGLRRRILVDGEGVHVETEAQALDRPAPLLVAEHVAFGTELLDPEATVDVSAGRAYEWGGDGPLAPPPSAPSWPEAQLLDGRVERVDRMPEQGPSRLLTVADVPEGRALVANSARGLAYRLTWDADWLRHVWLWREEHSASGPWRNRASVLVVEPATVPHDRGLAYSTESGEARLLETGETIAYSMSLRTAD
jgi:hypothetical protein